MAKVDNAGKIVDLKLIDYDWTHHFGFDEEKHSANAPVGSGGGELERICINVSDCWHWPPES